MTWITNSLKWYITFHFNIIDAEIDLLEHPTRIKYLHMLGYISILLLEIFTGLLILEVLRTALVADLHYLHYLLAHPPTN